MTFVHPSTLCRLRKRLGQEGPSIIEEQVCEPLKRRAVIDADMRRMDPTVLASPIRYPTAVRLLSQAFDQLAALATEAQRDLEWNPSHVTPRWRASTLPQQDRLASLRAFSTLLVPACASLAEAPRAPSRKPSAAALEPPA